LGRKIFRTPIHDDHSLGETELFVDLEPGLGYPDGPVFDSEGCLWCGMFGGWGVRRYASDARLMQVVQFPVANVTKIAFGGDGLTKAYATTARKGLDSASLAGQPLAGDLFAFEAGVAGLPIVPARL
jgi:sugar lactone lactonase YvrE